MDYRIGTCSSCGAEFKVPSSFEHDVARCKSCGDGVVRFPPVKGSHSPEVPAKKVVARPSSSPAVPKPVEVKSEEASTKRKERGTLARLKAERAAQAAAGGASAQASSQESAPSKAPVAARRGAPKATPRTESRPASSSSRTKARAGASRKGAGAKRSGGRSSRRRGGHRDEEETKRKGPMVPVLIVLVLAAGAAGLYFSGILGGDSGESTGEASDASASTDGAATEGGSTTPDEPTVAESSTGSADDAPAATPPETAPEPEAKKKPAAPTPVDLSSIEDFGPARGTTDEEWQQLNDWMETFTDLDAGAAGPRAGKKIVALGRKAFPVIINAMKTFDYASEDGFQKGNMCQKALQEILNGANYGWRSGTSPEDVTFNEKAVLLYSKIWTQTQTDIKAFIAAAKLKTKDPEEAARLESLYGDAGAADSAPTGGSGDDDLDVD